MYIPKGHPGKRKPHKTQGTSRLEGVKRFLFNTCTLISHFRLDNNCWFSHDVTKIQTKKLSILPRFYFHDALEQLKTNFLTNFRFKRVLGFVIEDA